MTITLVNPEALPKVDFHRQVAIATGSPGTPTET
jgi:hypothetical protein